MTNARQDGFYLLLVGSLLFVAVGFMWQTTSSMGPTDFKEMLSGTRCLLEGGDPYRPDQLWHSYLAHDGDVPPDAKSAANLRLVVSLYTNLPTTLALLVPFAILPWKYALAAWMAIIIACFIAACSCVWRLGADSAPRFSGALIFLLMIDSGLLVASGNTAGIVISLSAVAVCCFLRERYAAAGVVCLALALIIKPHDAAFVWFYFLLAGGVRRKRALQAAALAAVLALLAVLWVSHLVPYWLPEYHTNLLAATSRGGRDYAGVHTGGGLGVVMIINLQAALSLIRDDTHFFNPVAYAICGVLLLIWSAKTLRSRFSPRLAWFAIAAISVLTLLPVYHRTYDARLLLLTVPACAILWKEGGPLGWCALALNAAAIVLTGDPFWIAFFQITHYSRPSVLFGMIPAPLVLLALSIFYLWVYLRADRAPPAADAREPQVLLSAGCPRSRF